MSVKVYFGGLPEAITEEVLRTLLTSQGVGILESDNVWVKSGYAFAMYENEDAANEAIAKFNGFVYNDLTMVAEVAKDSDKKKSNAIRISGVSSGETQKTLEPVLSKFGKVETIEFVPHSDPENKVVTVTYQSIEEAEEAVQKLNEEEFSGTPTTARIMTGAEKAEGLKKSGKKGSPNHGVMHGQQSLGSPGVGVQRKVDFPLRVLVQSEMVGAIIGRGGQTIRQITQESRARVDVHRKDNVGSVEKAITVYGQPENCSNACNQIMKVMLEEAKSTGKSEDIPLKILAHNNLVGRIIGKQGATIKRIMSDTNTKITVSSINEINNFNMERVITVKGELGDIAKAESEISAKLRAAYEGDVQAMAPQLAMYGSMNPAMAAMMGGVVGVPYNQGMGYGTTVSRQGYHVGSSTYYQNFGSGMTQQPVPNADGLAGMMGAMTFGARPPAGYATSQEVVHVYIPGSSVGAVIGTKGTYIREIIRITGASIKIATQDESGVSNGVESGSSLLPSALVGTRKVTIMGSVESQHKAQICIWEKVEEDHFSNAQPGANVEPTRWHLEVTVPSVHVGRIIGKQGANVRDLQRKTGTMIKLPEGGTTKGDETPVLIVGPVHSVWACQGRLREMTREAISVSPPVQGQQQQAQAPHYQPVNGSGHHHDTPSIPVGAEDEENHASVGQ